MPKALFKYLVVRIKEFETGSTKFDGFVHKVNRFKGINSFKYGVWQAFENHEISVFKGKFSF